MGSTASRVEASIWVLIYIGLILVGLGLSVQRSDAALGWGIAAVGSAAVVIGIALIWLRSRMKD